MALPKGTVPFFWHPCHKNRDSPEYKYQVVGARSDDNEYAACCGVVQRRPTLYSRKLSLDREFFLKLAI